MTDGFEGALEDAERGMVLDLAPESSSLLVAFGGIANQMAVPPFEFFRLASALEAKKVFLRDLDQSWYHRGVLGLSTDVESTASALRRILVEAGAARVVFTGNSAGAYAALLFGAAMPAPVTVHAFSPQTFLGRVKRLLARDRRWGEQVREVQRISAGSPTMDLRKMLASGDGTSTLHIHYATEHRLDRLHAERIRNLPGVVLHPEESGGHNVIKALRERGELGPMISGALSTD
jgi:hypothetical protein